MARRKPVKVSQKHLDYLDSVRDDLVNAESVINSIKGSAEWKSAYNYFNTMNYRGILKTPPSSKNGYTLEFEKGVTAVIRGKTVNETVSVELLKGIVTDEQMKQIKQLIK